MTTIEIYEQTQFYQQIDGLDENGGAYSIPGTWTVSSKMVAAGRHGTVELDLEPVITTGSIYIDIETLDLEPGEYEYNIRLQDTNGNEFVNEPTKVRVLRSPTPLIGS